MELGDLQKPGMSISEAECEMRIIRAVGEQAGAQLTQDFPVCDDFTVLFVDKIRFQLYFSVLQKFWSL